MSPQSDIPVGLATKLGGIVAAIFGLAALITAVLHGDHSQETITLLVLAAVHVVIVCAGRYGQAIARELAALLGADKTV